MGPFAGVEVELGKAGFVVDLDSSFVFDGPLDVVHVNVVAEDLLSVFVGGFNGSAGEADEGGVGQGIAQVLGKAVGHAGFCSSGVLVGGGDDTGFEAVLGAVGFVGDEDDVAAIAQRFILAAPVVGGEFLDGGEDDATGGHLELGFEIGAVFGLLGCLPQQVLAVGEGGEELVVEVVAISEHHQGGVGHLGMLDDFSGVEGHREAFTGALGVPDDPGAAISFGSGGPQGSCDGFVDGVVLVVASQLFDDGFAIALEDGEIADQVEGAIGLKDAFEQDFEFVGGAGGIGATGLSSLGLTAGVEGNDVVGGGIAPGHEAGAIGSEGADAGAEAIGDDQGGVGGEEAGNVAFVGLELVKGSFDVGVFIGGVFEFDDGDG